jgi:SAM-dependent methyltransferase
MSIRELKDGLFSKPWIYDALRPLVVGGIDQKAHARFCSIEPDDHVFDLGCGTGQLLKHLQCGKYLGVDLDSSALEKAMRHASPNICFIQGDAWDVAFRELQPTVIIMIGVVHHLPDIVFRSMLARFRMGYHILPRIVTLDISYFPYMYFNNFLSKMDRGHFVRRPEQYEKLFHENGLLISRREFIATKLRYVRYVGYHLKSAS